MSRAKSSWQRGYVDATSFIMRSAFVFVSLLALGHSHKAQAEVKLPAIFSDHMVLQAEQPIRVWGTAEPAEQVLVDLAGRQKKTSADKLGRWRVTLPALPASFDSLSLVVTGTNQLVRNDILVGEVWVASGQSNMEFVLGMAQHGAEEMVKANHPAFRLFNVKRPETLAETTLDVDGAWAACTAVTAGSFSAVGYFFGRRLLENLKRPVGVISTSWGGTPVESWTSEAGLSANAEGKALVANLQAERIQAPKSPAEKATAVDAYQRAWTIWESENFHQNTPNQGEGLGFAKPGIPEPGWAKMQLPGHWENAGIDGDGAIWFRKDVALPTGWVGKDLRLHLGLLNDCDVTYVGGVKLGESCRNTPSTHGKARTFIVPAQLAKPGRLLIAVRVFDERGNGGFSSAPDELYIEPAAGGDRISLAGRWNYRTETLLPTKIVNWAQQPRLPLGYPHPHAPHALWDAMVAPLVPYAIRGAIWYQGESNAQRAFQYRTIFPGLIKDWRTHWGQGSFPFYYVQLANFTDRGHPSEWPELREAQTLTLRLANTGMAVAIDIGDPKDIHPTNKSDVGERLARWALARDYGQAVVPSGPLFKSANVHGDSMRITFKFGEGLKVGGTSIELTGFTMAGTDRQFVPATAVIEGDAIVVRATGISKPASVRYGWEGSPPCNLQNSEGLPASPFRTDKWPEVTRGRRLPTNRS